MFRGDEVLVIDDESESSVPSEGHEVSDGDSYNNSQMHNNRNGNFPSPDVELISTIGTKGKKADSIIRRSKLHLETTTFQSLQKQEVESISPESENLRKKTKNESNMITTRSDMFETENLFLKGFQMSSVGVNIRQSQSSAVGMSDLISTSIFPGFQSPLPSLTHRITPQHHSSVTATIPLFVQPLNNNYLLSLPPKFIPHLCILPGSRDSLYPVPKCFRPPLHLFVNPLNPLLSIGLAASGDMSLSNMDPVEPSESHGIPLSQLDSLLLKVQSPEALISSSSSSLSDSQSKSFVGLLTSMCR